VRRIPLTVTETAGIRRFGYPVRVTLPLDAPVKDTAHFRLLADGKPVTAQFRPCGDTAGGARAVGLDFNVDHAPREKRTYTVEYGPGVEPPAEPRGGMKVETAGDEFRVLHPGGLRFVVPRDLLGLLRGVRDGSSDYLRPDSAGLFLRSRDNTLSRAGGRGPGGGATTGRVVKQGPLAAALRFEGTVALGGGRAVASVVEMDFPVTKSWVRVSWRVDDPGGDVAGLGADLRLKVEGEPTLVDFGAGSYVYGHLRKGERAVLRAGAPGQREPAWETLFGPAAAVKPYVVAAPGQPPKAEGWAHVKDRQRCTAGALEGFAGAGQEAEITVDADGRLRLGKQFGRAGAAPAAGAKTMTFWLHFVGMPVQVGAATSPQAMLAPLQVRVGGPGR
jgi:hypothetical protein